VHASPRVVFVFAGADLTVFPSIADAQDWLEAIDVDDGEYTAALTETGRVLRMRTENELVVLEVTDELDSALLHRLLREHGQALGLPGIESDPVGFANEHGRDLAQWSRAGRDGMPGTTPRWRTSRWTCWCGRHTVWQVTIELKPLTAADAEAHCAGEDELTVRWLTGGYGDVEGTIEYFEWLAGNAAAGVGKRGFGIWKAGRLGGYIDYTPDLDDGLDPGDVALAYAVHPWARGQGVAVEAVGLVSEFLRAGGVGTRAAIRVEPENLASVRVAQKAGFRYVRDFPSNRDTLPDGTPTTFSLYLLDL
jgi:RimJ/RimL family protein N-acetyltransferase